MKQSILERARSLRQMISRYIWSWTARIYPKDAEQEIAPALAENAGQQVPFPKVRSALEKMAQLEYLELAQKNPAYRIASGNKEMCRSTESEQNKAERNRFNGMKKKVEYLKKKEKLLDL